jgi:hypothetical protein
VRGERSWDQFLNYCDVIAQIDGGLLRSAQMNDPRYDDEFAEILDKQPRVVRPPLAGDTAEIREMRGLRNDIRMLIAAMGGGGMKLISGPVTPAERLDKKRKHANESFFKDLFSRRNREVTDNA